MIPGDHKGPNAGNYMEADRVPGLPELALEVRGHVHGECDARAGEMDADHGEAGAVPRLERAVRKERVGEGVLDLREAALALVDVVPDDGEHADDAL